MTHTAECNNIFPTVTIKLALFLLKSVNHSLFRSTWNSKKGFASVFLINILQHTFEVKKKKKKPNWTFLDLCCDRISNFVQHGTQERFSLLYLPVKYSKTYVLNKKSLTGGLVFRCDRRVHDILHYCSRWRKELCKKEIKLCCGACNLYSRFCLASHGGPHTYSRTKFLYLGWWRDMGNFHKEALDMLPGKEAAFAFCIWQEPSSQLNIPAQSLLLTRFRKV